MTAVAPVAPQPSRLTPGRRSRTRRVKSGVASALIGLMFLIAMVPLVFLIVYVVEQGRTVEMFTNPKNQLTEDYVSGRFG